MLKKKSLSFLLSFFIIAVWVFSSQQLFAQSQQTIVPWEQEPHHRMVFQNKNVRIYDALIPPGDVTLFHTHSFDTVNITLSDGKGTNEFLGKETREVIANTGDVSLAKAYERPYAHQIRNTGVTPLRFIGAEVLASSASPGTPSALDALPGHKLVLENDRVKVYRISIDPKQATGIRLRTLPWLRISISQSMISIHESGKTPETVETKSGDYRWHEGGTTDSIENVGLTTYEAAEIEWK